MLKKLIPAIFISVMFIMLLFVTQAFAIDYAIETPPATAIFYELPDGVKLVIDGERVMGYIGTPVDVEIPAVIDKAIVGGDWDINITAVYGHAFSDCDTLESVVIPEGVKYILERAFNHCDNLETAELPSTIEEIGFVAFENCEKLESIAIPDSAVNGLSNGGNSLFKNCRALESVILPEGLIKIGQAMFEGCWSLTSIVIPDTVTTIGENAFYRCSVLSSVTIPESVTKIENSAFAFAGLESLTIPESVLEIGNEAFYYLNKLTVIDIKNGVESIGNKAFGECSILTTITIPESVTAIGEYVFVHSGLKSAVLECELTAIPKGMFDTCEQLLSFRVPAGIIEIKEDAFKWCTRLETLRIPQSVVTIGTNAFLDFGVYVQPEQKTTIYGRTSSFIDEYAGDNSIPFVPTAVESNLSFEADFDYASDADYSVYIEIGNETGVDISGKTILIAFFDDEDKLIDITVLPLSIYDEGIKYFDVIADKAALTLKCFIWKDTENITPFETFTPITLS